MNANAPALVTVSHTFSAPAERVFDAWLDVGLIGRWMFGPALREEEIVHLETDPRVGGRFSFVVRRQGQEIDHVGEYLEIARPTRLVFTWGIAGEKVDTSRVAIGIAPAGAGCELTLVHELHPDWADYAERTRNGWTTMIGVLGRLLDA